LEKEKVSSGLKALKIEMVSIGGSNPNLKRALHDTAEETVSLCAVESEKRSNNAENPPGRYSPFFRRERDSPRGAVQEKMLG
jgi:hypothetical protein